MEKKKKNATGVRFNGEQMEFVMKEENLKTPQKVVNFLLAQYWWSKKIGAYPTLERQDVPRENTAVPQEPKETPPKQFKNSIEKRLWEIEQEQLKNKK